MNNSNQLQEKQITKYLGHHEEVQVETGNNQGTLSRDLALSKRERESMILVMKRVIKNGGSHGVDDMGCNE